MFYIVFNLKICVALLIESIARFLRVLMSVGFQGEALLAPVFCLKIAILNPV
jgi:hypothetical protein